MLSLSVQSIITLTTDFGTGSIYTASIKGVILGVNPEAKLVDISHDIEPQNLLQASVTVNAVHGCFPAKTIHLVVVDPGVGTERRALILKTPNEVFVAPDNGVLSHIFQKYGVAMGRHAGDSFDVRLPDAVEGFSITNREYWRTPVSATFHGRDIFAPVAARLSSGMEPAKFGPKINEVVALPLPHSHVTGEGISGHVQYIDSFGNLITDITRKDLESEKGTFTVQIGDRIINGLVATYQESAEDIMALIGSMGYLEIAVRDGNAAAALDAGIGDRVLVKPAL